MSMRKPTTDCVALHYGGGAALNARGLIRDSSCPLRNGGEIAGLDQFMRLEAREAPELVAARLAAAMVCEPGGPKMPISSSWPNIR